ncbi:MAG: YdcF family protein [Bacteroidetes bacterium]|nr:YdcF family protein [Bacteroidota bacterium]
MKFRFSRVWLFLLTVFILIVSAVVWSNLWVINSTEDRVYQSADQLPHYDAALVLGTSSKVRGGAPNPFFVYRMDKAAQLYRNGKVDQLILSGDNRTRFYDEPGAMLDALIKKGIPRSVMVLDTAGLRTFDSIERSKMVFGKQSLIVVTQPFHAYRALFLCDHLNIPAVVFAAREPGEKVGPQVYIREYFARTKAVLDVYLFSGMEGSKTTT